MLQPEDASLLGMSTVPVRRSASGVSQALRAIERNETEDGGARAGHDGFRLKVASGIELRERAYRLAREVYWKKGYLSRSTRGSGAEQHDARPDTLTVLAEDRQGADAGTVTVILDGPAGLPCDEIFGPEMRALRARGRWPAEVTRLAINEAHAHAKDLLTLLCSVPFVFARRVRGFTDLVIEVNPRHAPFYMRRLGFSPIGAERPCPRVNGAPAILLSSDLVDYEQEMARIGGRGALAGKRCLFAYFPAGERERGLADKIAQCHRPITNTERRHFGLDAVWQVPVGTEGLPTKESA